MIDDFSSTPPHNYLLGIWAILFAFALSMLAGSGEVLAETVCNNMPAQIDPQPVTQPDPPTTQRILCEKEKPDNTDVDIAVSNLAHTISTTGVSHHGIRGNHTGGTSTNPANVNIDVTGGTVTTITTKGDRSNGIFGSHTGVGDIDIDVTGTSGTNTITTTGSIESNGIYARHAGSGNIDIDVTGTSGTNTIATTGASGEGISAYHVNMGHIDIDIKNGMLTTSDYSAIGVYATHSGTGNIDIDLAEGTTINTKGLSSPGVNAKHEGSGNIDINLTDVNIITESTATIRGISRTYGVIAWYQGSGDVDIDIEALGGSIETAGTNSYGLYAFQVGDQSEGDIAIRTHSGHSITTTGANGHGVHAWHQGSGKVDIDAQGGSIETAGTNSHGLYVLSQGASSGDIGVRTHSGHSITTTGANGYGIVAYHYGQADTRSIDITVGGTVTTEGADAQGVRVGAIDSGAPARMAALDDEGYRRQTVTVNNAISSQGEGIYLANGGRVIIGARGSIRSATGAAIRATGTVPAVEDDMNTLDVDEAMLAIPPKLRVDLNLGGRRIAQALGDGWHIINDGGETTIAMNNVVLHDGATGATGSTAANGAWNVRMLADGVTITDRTHADPAMWVVSDRAEGVIADRDFSAEDFTEIRRPTPPPPEPKVIYVNAPIVADASALAGVVVEGDCIVQIGAQGSLRAASGIAILATGDTPELTVDMALDGRQVGQVIGDDWIINDGGGTTLVINGVKLHDATTGVVPGAAAPNGARNVRMDADSVHLRAEGVRVLDRTDPDPANWVLSDPAEGVIADRDFSATDFIQEGTDPKPTTPPMLIEDYSPRAALYEALPNVLLGLQQRTPRSRPNQPAWLRVTGSTGSHELDRSTVGAEYDTDYVEIEAGKHFTLNNGLEAWATLQYLTGTAEVDSPMKGGDIDVQGLGLALELCSGCKSESGYIAGRLSLARYDLDLDSDERGRLKSGVDAFAHSLHLEAGRRLQRGNIRLTPRIRLDHARVSVDRFTDTVDARVSYPDEERTVVALGVHAETQPKATQDGLSLWGSLDLEHRPGDHQTVARVSGERLTAQAQADNSLLLGLGGTWRLGSLALEATMTTREALDGEGEDTSGSLSLGMQF